MEAYVRSLQLVNFYDIQIPVLRCCIKAGSSVGYCSSCLENFRSRNGPYYEGFVYPDDDELLERVASGEKPWATIPCEEEDEGLEFDIEDLGLHIVSADVNKWGMLCYEIIKDRGLKLSDLADLEKIGDILKFPIEDRYLVDIIDLDTEPEVIKGIIYGYPFYTMPPLLYVLDPSKDLDDEPLDELVKLLFAKP